MTTNLFRHAICNEVFQEWDFRDACRAIHRAGYTGIEIAPFTLAEDPATISAERRREVRSIIADEGLEFVGIHWLLPSPKGLHVTTPDEGVRARSWQHVHCLIDLCGDLGGGVMVFGSPHQRKSTGGLTREEATRHFVQGIAEAAPHAESRGVTILIEPLAVGQSDVVQTLDEAADLVRQIGSPAVQTMFDSHNAVDEVTAHAELVDRHFDMIRHIHVNEMDGRHPGTGDYDFQPVLSVLKQKGYTGWISLEAFDFTPGAERVASESISFMQSQIERLGE